MDEQLSGGARHLAHAFGGYGGGFAQGSGAYNAYGAYPGLYDLRCGALRDVLESSAAVRVDGYDSSVARAA
jgi:hypothetical protein